MMYPLVRDLAAGYAIDLRMKSRLAVAVIADAVARRGGARMIAGCVVHLYRGSQFHSRKFQQVLRPFGLVGSMSRVGATGDIAAMERFLAVLQKNVLDRGRWDTRASLRIAVVDWGERTYHRKRRQRRLGKLTSVE